MRGKSVGQYELYAEWFNCTVCNECNILKYFKFCPDCGSPTEPCKHPKTFENGTCMDCGISTVNDPRFHCQHLTVDKGICFDCGEPINNE